MSSKKRPDTLAKTLAELEVLANRLEDNDTPLEQSLKDFESGIQLIRQAQKTLLEAEQKVQMLLDQKGEPVAAPLAESDVSGEIEDDQ